MPEGLRPDGGAARFTVLPVPYDLTVSYVSGARGGPRAILEASAHMELYDEELRFEPIEAGIRTLPFLEPTAAGPEAMAGRVEEAVSEIVEGGSIPVVLGGEHSITVGLVRALFKAHGSLSVLQLDAHADMRDRFEESPYSHACVARRISEICPIVQVGVRSLSAEEAAFLDERAAAGDGSVRTFYAAGMRGGVPVDEIVSALSEKVCVTVDLDCLDPSIMPATGTPEPGGLGWHDVLGLLRAVASHRKVVGMDVVELSPLPGNVAPDFTAARLVYKMMGYAAMTEK
ncbi:MAG TPA: agmatinase [Deltaproteobacteria bacterium]|nr:agmatinase [Deltaproteobacteria bacterium]